MKKVKVTDLNIYLQKSIGEEMEERGLEVRDILVTIVNGDKAIVTNKEGVHNLHSLDEKISVDLFKKSGINENGNKTIAIMPSARVEMTISELIEGSTGEVELSDFIRRFGQRLESNYKILLNSIKEIGLDPKDYRRKELREAGNE